MGIHYDYKSTRGDKAMKKEAKRKARIEQRRAKRSNLNPKQTNNYIKYDANIYRISFIYNYPSITNLFNRWYLFYLIS